MNSQAFLRIIDQAFVPFLADLGLFKDSTVVHGRMYCVDFKGTRNKISISFEPGDNALYLYVFSIEIGVVSHIDDLVKTPRIEHLNRLYMPYVSRADREQIKARFAGIEICGPLERLLLKAAKDLSLVLPLHLGHSLKK
jgi:hypothetical protein